MNYHNMIEPYLYGSLSPEDEVAFERQMTRDPALVEAAARRLNAEAALSQFKVPQHTEAPPRRSPLPLLLVVGFVAGLLALVWWKTCPSAVAQEEAHLVPTEQTDVQSKALSD